MDLTEHAYLPHGGTTQIHFFRRDLDGETRLLCAAPVSGKPHDSCGRRRVLRNQRELLGISGKVLRTFTVAADPTPLYRDLYATAEAAFDAIAAILRAGTTTQQIIEVSGVIEKAGFTTCDDLMHGYGGGYFPPVLGSQSRPAESPRHDAPGGHVRRRPAEPHHEGRISRGAGGGAGAHH